MLKSSSSNHVSWTSNVTIAVARAAPETVNILGAYFADVHGFWGRVWEDVDREMMWGGDI